jgi:predicted O-methyltransferase YrrM
MWVPSDPEIRRVFGEVWNQAAVADARVIDDVRGQMGQHGADYDDEELARIFEPVALPLRHGVASFIYLAALTTRASTIVEFGTSIGLGTVILASAMHDNGIDGRVITCEFSAGKISRARSLVKDVGLDSYVEFRLGNALETLRATPPVIDMVFLDGWQGRYLEVLKLLEPSLQSGSMVVADDIFPEVMTSYLSHVRSPAYISTPLRLESVLEVSVRRSPMSQVSAE